jgi:hypothetical protein
MLSNAIQIKTYLHLTLTFLPSRSLQVISDSFNRLNELKVIKLERWIGLPIIDEGCKGIESNGRLASQGELNTNVVL